jgi:hypothetical protein
MTSIDTFTSISDTHEKVRRLCLCQFSPIKCRVLLMSADSDIHVHCVGALKESDYGNDSSS